MPGNSNSNSNDGENLIGASGTISQEDFDNLFSDDQSASDDQSNFFTPNVKNGIFHTDNLFVKKRACTWSMSISFFQTDRRMAYREPYNKRTNERLFWVFLIAC